MTSPDDDGGTVFDFFNAKGTSIFERKNRDPIAGDYFLDSPSGNPYVYDGEHWVEILTEDQQRVRKLFDPNRDVIGDEDSGAGDKWLSDLATYYRERFAKGEL